MRFRQAVALAFVASGAFAQDFGEQITVSRVLVDVRVTKIDGEPITDLTSADFTVTLGGKPAIVESAAWIDDAHRTDADIDEQAAPAQDSVDARSTTSRGRTIVVFVQTDFQREPVRVGGQMKFQYWADQLIAMFEPDDRIAVFSFDSHLKFRSDLTTNKEDAAQAIRASLAIDTPPPPPVVPEPSLARHLDAHAMLRAPSSEVALRIVGDALKSIEGPKTMLLVGWGLGERVGRMVYMRPEWKTARRSLDDARVTIISLDTTMAAHDLAAGLGSAAAETGGFYMNTNTFPQQVIDRVQRTISGRYELELRTATPLQAGTYELVVRVKQRGARVLAPQSVTIHEQ
jgi:VWFA-related protein